MSDDEDELSRTENLFWKMWNFNPKNDLYVHLFDRQYCDRKNTVKITKIKCWGFKKSLANPSVQNLYGVPKGSKQFFPT